MQIGDSVVIQCTLVALTTLDKVKKWGKRLMVFTKIMQCCRETFTDFLHRFTSAINREISNLDVKKVPIEILAVEMLNVQSS